MIDTSLRLGGLPYAVPQRAGSTALCPSQEDRFERRAHRLQYLAEDVSDGADLFSEILPLFGGTSVFALYCNAGNVAGGIAAGLAFAGVSALIGTVMKGISGLLKDEAQYARNRSQTIGVRFHAARGTRP